MEEIRDGYLRMMDNFGINESDIVDWGIAEIIDMLPPIDKVRDEWDKLKKSIETGNNTVYIRGYGQNKNDGRFDYFVDAYRTGFDRLDLCMDGTNNSAPHALMKRITGFRVNKRDCNIYNYKLSHIWGYTKNIYLFACPWNVIFTPTVIDPLTGHESSGRVKKQFCARLTDLVFSRYEEFIDDYNTNVLNSDEVKRVIEYAPYIFADKEHMRLLSDFREGWSPLTRDNILKG